MEEIILIGAITIMFIVGSVLRKKYLNTRKGLLIFFLVFVALIVTFTVNLIDHFSYIKLFVILLLAVFGTMDYYKRYSELKHG